MSPREDSHPDVLKFRSHVDFRRDSWLIDEKHHTNVPFKAPENIYYDIKWSPEYQFSLSDETGEVQIVPSSWSLPFHLEIEQAFFVQTTSDDALAFKLQTFMAHLIDCIEHIHLEIDVIKFKLDGRPILFEDPTSHDWRRLKYTEQKINLNEIFEEYSLLGESGHDDVVCLEAGNKKPMELCWQLLIDSIASFESAHFHGCVIYACSAVEVEVVPVVRDWLTKNTLTGSSEHVEKALIDLSNPIKFEIFFGCGNVEALNVLLAEQRTSLLGELKWLNTVRNKVIHSGYDVQSEEACRAIRAAGLLLRVLWVHKQQQTLRQYGVSDIYSGFRSEVRKVKF